MAEQAPVQVVQEEISAFGTMLEMGQINQDLYHKLLVTAAFQFAQLGEFMRAAATVQLVPPEYFQNVQARHMAEDKDYCEVAFDLAKALVDNDLIDLAPQAAYNHPPAQA